MEKIYHVFVLVNMRYEIFYVGVTKNLKEYMDEHKAGRGAAFPTRYNVDDLVYYESGLTVDDALARRHELGLLSIKERMKYIETVNSEWKDMYDTLS